MSHPVQYHVELPDRYSRLTAFFRLILVIPHAIVAALWGLVAYLATIVAWFAIVITGRNPLWSFSAAMIRYYGRVVGYQMLVANTFPPFNGDDPYTINVTIDQPDGHNRLTTFFRIIMIIPAAILQYILGQVANLVGIIQWLIIVFTASCPEGLAQFQVTCQRYTVRTLAYGLLLTDRYPNFDADATPSAAEAPAW